MPTFSLISHPDHPSLLVSDVTVGVSRREEELHLTYRVGNAEQVVWPELVPPERADELWRATCFELFLLFDDDERYVEFNFSPSTQWAAYAFNGYRDSMTPLARDVAPAIRRLDHGIAIACDLGGLPHGDLRMALTAVIEEAGGVKSYWSLAHPPGAPDFHHPACFAARLPAPELS